MVTLDRGRARVLATGAHCEADADAAAVHAAAAGDVACLFLLYQLCCAWAFCRKH